jgi:hypothetical protein
MPTSQDLIKGLDLTALTEVTGSEMNQLVDAGSVAADKGLRIVTTDSALNTPVVPNPDVELEGITPTQWKRYKWVRLPFLGSGGIVREYNWNPEKASIATYLRWEETANTEGLQEEIDEVRAIAEAAQTDADAAQTSATAAQNAATAAQNTANSAQNAANIANASIGGINSSIADINETLEEIQEKTDQLEFPLPLNKGGTQATNFQDALSNLGLNKAIIGTVILNETQLGNIEGGTFTAGAWQKRTLDHKYADSRANDMVTLNADSTITLAAFHNYLIEVEAPAFGVENHQARIHEINPGISEFWGSCEYAGTPGNPVLSKSKVIGLFYDIENLTGRTVQIEHRCKVTQPTNGLGLANDFSGVQVYTQVKIHVIGWVAAL